MQGSQSPKEKKLSKRRSCRCPKRELSIRWKEDQVHSSHPTQSNASYTNKPKMQEISLSTEKEISLPTEKEPPSAQSAPSSNVSSPRKTYGLKNILQTGSADSPQELKTPTFEPEKNMNRHKQKIENSDLCDQIENKIKNEKKRKRKTDKPKKGKEQLTPPKTSPKGEQSTLVSRPKTNQEIPKIPFESTLENSESPNPSTPQLLSLNESDGDILVSTVMKDFSNCPDTIIQYLHSKKKNTNIIDIIG